jgi:hypothetical protein
VLRVLSAFHGILHLICSSSIRKVLLLFHISDEDRGTENLSTLPEVKVAEAGFEPRKTGHWSI